MFEWRGVIHRLSVTMAVEVDMNGSLWHSVSLCTRSGSRTQAKGLVRIGAKWKTQVYNFNVNEDIVHSIQSGGGLLWD